MAWDLIPAMTRYTPLTKELCEEPLRAIWEREVQGLWSIPAGNQFKTDYYDNGYAVYKDGSGNMDPDLYWERWAQSTNMFAGRMPALNGSKIYMQDPPAEHRTGRKHGVFERFAAGLSYLGRTAVKFPNDTPGLFPDGEYAEWLGTSLDEYYYAQKIHMKAWGRKVPPPFAKFNPVVLEYNTAYSAGQVILDFYYNRPRYLLRDVSDTDIPNYSAFINSDPRMSRCLFLPLTRGMFSMIPKFLKALSPQILGTEYDPGLSGHDEDYDEIVIGQGNAGTGYLYVEDKVDEDTAQDDYDAIPETTEQFFSASYAAGADPVVEETTKGVVGNQEVVTLSLTEVARPTSGTWTITYNAHTTSVLQYNSTLQQIVDAIEALVDFSPGDITNQTGGPIRQAPVVLTFDAALGDLSAFTINDIDLRGTCVAAAYYIQHGELNVSDTIQRIGINYADLPTSGTFTLTFDGQTTSSLNWNATHLQVQTALRNLSNLDAATVSVNVSGPFPGSHIEVVFDKSIAVAPLLIFDTTNLVVGITTNVTQVDPGAEAATDEVQTVGMGGGPAPTSGTYTLTFDGQTTSSLLFNASAATVETALEALSNLGAADVAVAGGPIGSTLTVTFDSSLGDVPLLIVDADFTYNKPTWYRNTGSSVWSSETGGLFHLNTGMRNHQRIIKMTFFKKPTKLFLALSPYLKYMTKNAIWQLLGEATPPADYSIAGLKAYGQLLGSVEAPATGVAEENFSCAIEADTTIIPAGVFFLKLKEINHVSLDRSLTTIFGGGTPRFHGGNWTGILNNTPPNCICGELDWDYPGLDLDFPNE